MPPPADGFASRLFHGPALRTQPDWRLVTLVCEGYESAFEEIVRRYGKPLTRYAAAIVGSRGEDVTQDAFSKALLALRRNDAEIELRPWLFRIVRNTALNDLRDSPPTPKLLAEAIVGGSSPAEEMERREELTDLMHRLQSLPEPQRAAIVMREMEGLSHEEIATALGVSGGAARQAIHRARQALRNGAGMLVPLPALKALLAAGTIGTAEVAAAGAGSTAGAGIALKAVTATVLVAGAVGTGVAVHDSRHASGRSQDATASASAPRSETALPAASFAALAPTSGEDRSGGEQGDDHHGRGKGDSGDDRGHGGHRGESGAGDDHGGGPGPGDGGGGSEVGDHHGSSSGPGSGRSGDDSHSGGSGDGGGPGPSGGGGHSGGSSGHGGSSHSGSSGQTSGSSGGDFSDDPSSETGGGSGGGPGPNEPSEPAETSGGSGGSGPSDGSGTGSDGTSGFGSGSDDDLAGGASQTIP